MKNEQINTGKFCTFYMAGETGNDHQLIRDAQAFIVAYLRKHGDTPGETITDACKQAGIVPRDDRHFGAAFRSLSKRGIIHKVGTCLRRKGHATSGGNVWGLTNMEER